MTKILVVDDEADLEVLIKQKFRKKIRENAYQFVFALNGLEALERLEEHRDVDIVLSDINMPEMDGLTLLEKLAEQHSLLKAVMVSAYGDMSNIRIAMNRGAFDFITKPINFQDLEVTIEKTIGYVEQMRETMKAIKENNILKMYVDESVIKFMGSKEFEAAVTTNEAVDATVMFVDICGFTSFSEQQNPDTVVDVLNYYFDIMVKEIIDQNGHVDKFIGDALMAVFQGEYHVDRAIDSALSIRAKLQDLPDAPGDFQPKVSIGINSGEMVSGNIGSVTLRRFDFTVIGDTVNTAQRLEAAAEPNQILIPQHAYDKVKEAFSCKEVGELKLKNKSNPVRVYEVIE